MAKEEKILAEEVLLGKSLNEQQSLLYHAGYTIDEIFDITNHALAKKALAFEKLTIIIGILNEGWYPDWENESEYKYYNYFNTKDGFSYWSTDYCNTYTDVPSALCLKSNDLATYTIKHHLELYKDLYE